MSNMRTVALLSRNQKKMKRDDAYKALKYRNGKMVQSSEGTVVKLEDDGCSGHKKYFLKHPNGIHEEVFQQATWNKFKLHQLQYADRTVVPPEATVIAAHDGMRQRYFEIKPNEMIVEVHVYNKYRIKKRGYLFVQPQLCCILIYCVKHQCTIPVALAKLFPDDKISVLIKTALNIGQVRKVSAEITDESTFNIPEIDAETLAWLEALPGDLSTIETGELEDRLTSPVEPPSPSPLNACSVFNTTKLDSNCLETTYYHDRSSNKNGPSPL